MTFDEAMAFALSLPGTQAGTSYGKPAAKVTANGRPFLATGHEPDTSFVLMLDEGLIDLLKETDPEAFWQTPHYEGYAAVLVRYDAPDPDRVRETIERSRDWVAARPPPRARRK